MAREELFFGGQVFFGQVWDNPGKIYSHLPKFACFYTYASPSWITRILCFDFKWMIRLLVLEPPHLV